MRIFRTFKSFLKRIFFFGLPSGLQLFLLLFGFFLGNLSPAGFVLNLEPRWGQIEKQNVSLPPNTFGGSVITPILPIVENLPPALQGGSKNKPDSEGNSQSLPIDFVVTKSIESPFERLGVRQIGVSAPPIYEKAELHDTVANPLGFDGNLDDLANNLFQITTAEWVLEQFSQIPGPAASILFAGEIINYASQKKENKPVQNGKNTKLGIRDAGFFHNIFQDFAKSTNRFSIRFSDSPNMQMSSSPPNEARTKQSKTPVASDRFTANLPGEIGGPNYKIDRKRKHYASRTTRTIIILAKRFLNTVKIGFLLGVFVDGFKVGS